MDPVQAGNGRLTLDTGLRTGPNTIHFEVGNHPFANDANAIGLRINWHIEIDASFQQSLIGVQPLPRGTGALGFAFSLSSIGESQWTG